MKAFKILGSDHYAITDDLQILRKGHAVTLDPFLDTSTNMKLITLFNYEIAIPLDKLLLLAKAKIELPNKHVPMLAEFRFEQLIKPHMQTFFKDGIVVTLDRPIEFTYNNVVHRLIPSHREHAISKDGRSLLTLAWTVDGEDYRVIDQRPIVSTVEYPTMWLRQSGTSEKVHRITALTWCHNSNFNLRPIVNHIDGDPTNTHADNLEWCSYKENNLHARDNGLTNDSFKTSLKHNKTGEIKEFISLQAASDFLEIALPLSSNVRRYPIGKTVKGWEMRMGDDDKPWAELGSGVDTTSSQLVKVTNKVTKEVKYWPGLKPLYISLFKTNPGSTKQTLARLARERQDLTVDVPFIEKAIADTCFFYQARSLTTNEVITCEIEEQLHKRLGLPSSTVSQAITAGPEVLNKHLYTFRKVKKKELEWPTVTKNLRANNKYLITNLKTGETKESTSMREMNKITGIAPKTFSTKFENSKEIIAKGFSVKDISPVLAFRSPTL